MSPAVVTQLFTVGVFQDHAWARRGLDALLAAGFSRDSLTLLTTWSPASLELMSAFLATAPLPLQVKTLGPVAASGPLLAALQGADGRLERQGLASTIGLAGFQQHDGYIFETLVGRGGVLVAIMSEARASDALAKLHAYGGGNAGIGAWTGRV